MDCIRRYCYRVCTLGNYKTFSLISEIRARHNKATLQAISFWPSRIPFGQHKIVDPYNRSYVFPLYLYPDPSKKGLFDTNIPSMDSSGRHPNLSPVFITALSSKLNKEFIPNGKGD